jgi:uncharacterized membrane protein HdeD (DUF308 family)
MSNAEGIMIETLTRNWGWVALRGAVAILFGILTLFFPGITLAVLILWFGVYAFVDGLFTVISAIARRRGERHWVVLLIGGLLGIAAGLVTFFTPGITAVVLLAVIAVWAILVGLAEIVAAVRLRRVITGEWLFILAGLLAVAFGVILILRPAVGALAMMMWIGAYAVVSGALLLALSLRLRSWDRLRAEGPTARTA